MFPKLLGGLQNRSVAAAILDLANFLTREHKVERHPAADHSSTLINMLGLLTEQLTMIEEGNLPPGQSAEEVSRTVNDTVSLITALCDSLALIGDEAARGKLARAADLKHRRIRTEALAALIRLGDEQAAEQLPALANEPISRLRVLNYCEELGLSDKIDPAWTTSAARAESELAIWLAQPENMGLAPKSLQLIDQRELAWPGYDDPIDCFLFRYSYELGSQSIENIGIAGPLLYAFSVPLTDLPLEDVYAAFAGWQSTHEEISESTIEEVNQTHPGLVDRLMSRLTSEQMDGLAMESVTPVFAGFFMGNQVLIAEGIRHGQHGSLLIDRDDVEWFELSSGMLPGRNELAWSIYKGRRLLGAFNTPEAWPGRSETGQAND